jgi:hypothetical protein
MERTFLLLLSPTKKIKMSAFAPEVKLQNHIVLLTGLSPKHILSFGCAWPCNADFSVSSSRYARASLFRRIDIAFAGGDGEVDPAKEDIASIQLEVS